MPAEPVTPTVPTMSPKRHVSSCNALASVDATSARCLRYTEWTTAPSPSKTTTLIVFDPMSMPTLATWNPSRPLFRLPARAAPASCKA